jgi:flagellar hook-length control protein FliK
MQTPALPIQISGASASPAPTRATGMANTDSAQFSQALSREIDQRQHNAVRASASQAAPAKPQAAPAPQASSKPAAPAQAQASATAGNAAGAAVSDEARDDAADAAAVGPVADMLALVASFNQLVAAAPAQAAGLPGVPGKQSRDDAGIAMMAKAPGDDAGLAVKGGAGVTDGAPAFALETEPGGAEPTGRAAAPKADANGASAATLQAAADKTALLGAPDQSRVREADVAALKDLPAAAPLTAPAQQASAATAQAVTGAPTDRIAARVGTPGWDNQVGQKIVWMVAGKEQSASLTLNPPDMGPMQVVLNVTNDQATVTFTAAQPEVRQALEDAMPKLREMMSESGIALGNASVNAGSPEQRQAQQGEQSRANGAGGRFSGGAASAEPSVATRAVRSGAGMVDTFA